MTTPEATTIPDEERTPPPPTFAGRLKLDDFKFDNGSTSTSPSPGGIRRSTRLSTTKSTTTTITSSSASPRKSTHVQTTTTTTTTLSSSTTTIKTPSSKRKRLTSTSTSTSPSPSSDSLTPSSSSNRLPNRKKLKTYDTIPQSLPDCLSPNLILLFIGLNPGISTAITQHAYAHPTNLFWRLLHSSGITPVLCRPQEDRTLPKRFALGLTNIVGRPTRNGGELTKKEMDEGVEVLEEKVRQWRPERVCVVGKGIWEAIWRVRWRRRRERERQRQKQEKKEGGGGSKRKQKGGEDGDGGDGGGGGKLPKDWKYGWQGEEENMGVIEPREGEEGWKGARVFVATSTSGLAATVGRAEKEKIWRELGEWVEGRREEREKAKKQVEKEQE